MSTAPVVSLTNMKSYLRIPDTDTTFDATVQMLIDAAVDVLSYHVDDILPQTYTETYNGGSCSIWLYHKPVLSVLSVIENAGMLSFDLAFQDITAVTVGSTGSEGGTSATSIYAYSLDDPEVGMLTRRTVGNAVTPFAPGIRNVSVSYRSGYLVYPPAISLAVRELVAWFFQHDELRNTVADPGQMQYDATSREFVRSGENAGSMPITFGVPARIIDLVASHRRFPIFA